MKARFAAGFFLSLFILNYNTMKTQRILQIINIALLVIVPVVVITCLRTEKKSESAPIDTPEETEVLEEITESNEPNPYVEQYAGVYEIRVKGYTGTDTETYGLTGKGVATWTARIGDYRSTKKGTWTASEGEIKIIIQGNTGNITETYRLVNGSFVSISDSDRSLNKY